MNCSNYLLRPLLVGLFVLVLASSADGATLNVPADYSTIQAAVSTATAGDTILVSSGTYYENVNVNKALTLQGVDSGSGLPVVDGGGSGGAITLSADGCSLQGFVARNSGSANYGITLSSSSNTISGNTVNGNNQRGISLNSSNFNTISGNSVTDAIQHGIYLTSSSNNTISSNTANGNSGSGIYLTTTSNSNIVSANTASNNQYGIRLYASKGNTITGNTANNNDDGFRISTATENTIKGNTANSNSDRGIYLASSSNNNIIWDNTVTDNANYGIRISFSSGNTVYLNTLSNINNALSDGINHWNATMSLSWTYAGSNLTGFLGNIWSDYAGFDCDGDGMGDTPYLIAGGSGKDYHPIGGVPCPKKLLCISGYKHDGCTGLPLSGWKIKVNNSTQEWNTTTDGNGYWQVCRLEDNDTYSVCEVQQSGWAQTYPYPVVSHTETLAGVNITNINFTNQRMYCISGYKKDNFTGAPLPGWNITLTNATGTTSQLTGPDGKYEFCNLKPGDYTITEEGRSGYTPVSIVANPVTLNCSNLTNQNFTNQRLLCISGKKINHCTGNELSGWNITVRNSSGATVGTATTINTPVAQRGNWEVCGLLPGNYTVTETLRPGYLNITNLTQSVTLDCVNVTGIDFRNVPLFALGGYKLDSCTGERLGGWDISVKNLSTGKTITVTTLNTVTNRGRWRVTNLAPGLYQVTEIMKPGYINITPAVVNVTLGCANNYGINFTNQKLMCISGYKLDDCTKAGIEDWLITLSNSSYTTSIRTGSDGRYEFCNLVPGNYTLTEETPSGYISTGQVSVDVTLACTSNLTNQNFTNQKLLCINGTKINNCTGLPLAGWTINLLNASGSVIKTDTTDANGDYSFCELESGNYTVCEVPKAGWKNVTPICVPVELECVNIDDADFHNVPLLYINGTKIDGLTQQPLAGWTIQLRNASGSVIKTDTTDVNGDYSFCGLESGNYTVCEVLEDGWKNVTEECIYVELECDDEVVDFENVPNLCINGSKINNCTGEGLANWTIELRDEAGALMDSKRTDANGDYSFCNLEAGNYTICEALQGSWKNVTPSCIPVTLDTDNSENNDFANDPPVCISGRKINDCTEEGIAGWKITLYDALGEEIGTAITDANGRYSFCKLDPGIYYVCEEKREGWTAVPHESQSTLPSMTPITCNMPWCDDNCVCVDLTCEGAEVNFRNIPESLCINGSKINNCTGAGESGWSIYLYDATGTNIRTVQTDSRGRYSFCGLPPGQYRVCEEIRDGWIPVTYINHSGASCLPEDCTCDVCNNCIPVILDCENSEENDFENIPPTSIKGKVIDDCTGEGLPDWEIHLYDSGGNLLDTRWTEWDGSYEFVSSTTVTGGLKLTAGSLYTVCEVVQSGWTPVTYHANNTSRPMSNENCIPVFLDCGVTEVEDFENIPPLCISGHEFTIAPARAWQAGPCCSRTLPEMSYAP